MFDPQLLDAHPLDYLKGVLGDLRKGTTQDVLETNARLIDWLSDRRRFVGFVSRVLTTPELLADVASRSYRHVNHFDKLVLVGNDNVDGYRWISKEDYKLIENELAHMLKANIIPELIKQGLL